MRLGDNPTSVEKGEQEEEKKIWQANRLERRAEQVVVKPREQPAPEMEIAMKNVAAET